MPRSVGGLESAGEWPAFRALLPDLRHKRVLDLGCGFGWHCRYAREQGARSVIGVDLSENMLERAKDTTNDEAIAYRRCAIEDLDFGDAEFEVVISSLALHYLERFDLVCRSVCKWLTADGAFVFSVEHPIFTAMAAQEWCVGPTGERLHWPVDNYHEEGVRHTRWLADDVIKYHRTAATYVNVLIDSGFEVTRLLEPALMAEVVAEKPEWRDERRRPMFMVVGAVKKTDSGGTRKVFPDDARQSGFRKATK